MAEHLHKAWLDWSATLPPRANPVTSKPATAGAKPAQDRAALFELKDKSRDGKLSREEFLANQIDPETAKTRFETWDSDGDGFLSRAEFVTMRSK